MEADRSNGGPPTQPIHADGDRNILKPTAGGGQKVPILTVWTAVMAMITALGGFIFGYDTGQISGFLEMPVFLARFGQRSTDLAAHPTGYYFTNVRSGLIVGVVCNPHTFMVIYANTF